MESITSESSAASVGASPISPIDSGESTTPVADAPIGTEADQPAIESPDPATVAGDQDTFPDDASLQQMPGQERASNWERLRTRHGELKQRVEQLSQLEAYQPAVDRIEQLGGWEQAAPLLDLATSLFSPAVSPETGEPIIDPQSGMQQYTALPFVEQLAQDSPNTVAEILWHSFDQPLNDQETLGHWFLRERLGLDPALLGTYQQIKSPDQAREHIIRAGGIDPAELEGLPPEFHDVYKSFSPRQRSEFQLIEDAETRLEFLQDKQDALEARKYIEADKAAKQQQQAHAEKAWEARIEQRATQIIDEVRQASINTQVEKLKSTARFFADDADNADVHQDIIRWSRAAVEREPQLQKDLATVESLYKYQAQAEASRDKLRANQAKVEADRLVKKINKAFGDFITERTAVWSKRLGSARAVQQQRINDARPRTEIGTTGGNPGNGGGPNAAQIPEGRRFGLTEERKQQLAAQMQANRMRQ